MVQGHPGSRFILPIESQLLVFCLTSIESIIVSVTVFKIFKVTIMWPRSRMVQGQPKSKITVVSYSTSVDPIIVAVTVFEISDLLWVHHRISYHFRDIRQLFSIETTVKINSTSGLANMHIPDFHQKQQLLGLYLGSKFGEDRWKIATERSTRLCDRHSLTRTHKVIL